ncbi:DUF5791 family protein [Halobaculum gomorrense]|uniref:Uncharacterized protein n=1 Tax=Halobaculum gomorrense TaxID=43928 RepID=A0A1M5TL37_9EURY|nr:DUF5791 family protein [Halobaculum gomorrense]SHH51424.1 hypothetical protein SAMN05443636_2751 [Halobaculum gomorrense]
MLYDALADPEEATPRDLLEAYAAELATALDGADPATVAAETGVDESVVAAMADGDADAVATVRLGDAAAILERAEGVPAEAIASEVRDHVMMEMVTAILDVDTIAAEIDADLTGQEVQQALEGRTRLTLGELADMQALVIERTP